MTMGHIPGADRKSIEDDSDSAASDAMDDSNELPNPAQLVARLSRAANTMTADADGAAEASGMQRRGSAGFTGETFYDFDQPLNQEDSITIIHFNDVYNIVSEEPELGGIARFMTALTKQSHANPLILFSGDVFNPSTLSTISKGRQMVPFLNMIKVHTACYGNHDFDFGVDQLEYLAGSTQFPWLLSNVFEANSPFAEQPIANGRMYRVCEWQGHKIGLMGLVEKEWLTTLATIDEEDVVYVDFVQQADKISALLREKECSLIIALTHMRSWNDQRLAKEAKDIDLVLGGHDHEYYGAKRIGAVPVVVKSGTDFCEFTKIVIHPGDKTVGEPFDKLDYDPVDPPQGLLSPLVGIPAKSEIDTTTNGSLLMPQFCGGSSLTWERIAINEKTFEPNRHVNSMTKKYMKELEAQAERVIGYMDVPLETRFCEIRTKETNLGNWICDILRVVTKADLSVMNGGTVRSDRLFPAGVMKVRDLLSMLPMPEAMVVIDIPGAKILEMLENSVCMWPGREGRFLQVSGIHFSFKGSNEPGQRVIHQSVMICRKGQWGPLDLEQSYVLATKKYLWEGRDGFDCFQKCKCIMNEDDAGNLPTMVRNHFSLAAMANGYHRPHNPTAIRKVKQLESMPSDALEGSMGMKRVNDKGEPHYTMTCKNEGRIVLVE
eukprot:GHVU01012665.1.p1 GENE.GHVU01012665.1~~GHVU01012665.1.p1  ORF type:complete len:662 (-),score=158.75 GHVU01012665.1:335-2320(-)